MGRGWDIDRQATLDGKGERWTTNDNGGADNEPHRPRKPPMPPIYQNLTTSDSIDNKENANMMNTGTRDARKIARET
jgi:hypothetical protein